MRRRTRGRGGLVSSTAAYALVARGVGREIRQTLDELDRPEA